MSDTPLRASAVRVAIVVNNYNYEQFLGEAIDSALGQTHPHVSVIVVDDGSTDGSRALIASYGDRIEPVLKPNGGQASAFNAGFARVDADVVIFLDADDVLEPSTAEQVAAIIAEHPEVAKVQWRMRVIDADGRPTGGLLPAPHVPVPDGDMRRAELVFPFDIAWAATSGNAFRVSMLRTIMPMPEADYRISADSYLQHLPALLGSVFALGEPGVRRRIHGANAFEQRGGEGIDMRYAREAIRVAAVTRDQLDALATRLGLERAHPSILSVSDLARRLISLRLDADTHPVAADTRLSLAVDGVRAAARRFDVRPPLRLAFAGWFVVTSIAPRPIALRLGRWLLVPERRSRLNRLLALFHRGPREGTAQ